MHAPSYCAAVGRLLGVAMLCAAVAACAPAPLYRTGPTSVTATPEQVASSPANFHDLHVVWGGRVVWVHNFADHSELEVLAYPLDGSQRPRTSKSALGRFIVVMPGFVEPLNYPEGSLLTVQGTLDGARQGHVGAADYTFALVRGAAMHRWTAEEMRAGHPNVNIGVGVGGWIH